MTSKVEANHLQLHLWFTSVVQITALNILNRVSRPYCHGDKGKTWVGGKGDEERGSPRPEVWGPGDSKGSSEKTAGSREFPGDPVIEIWPSDAGATRDSVPGWGLRSLMPWRPNTQNITQKQYGNQFNERVSVQSCVRLFTTPWTGAHQASLAMGFSRQESLGACHFPAKGISHPRNTAHISSISTLAGQFLPPTLFKWSASKK